MTDPSDPNPGEPVSNPPSAAASQPAPVGHDARLGRYDANLQLIRRRLADHHRTTAKAKWWWPGR